MILGHVKNYVEDFLGKEVNKVVITVPAYFNEAQKRATKEAGEIAGFNVIRILNEPTAAAIAYGYNINKNLNEKKNILVFDLGGGTYDISILQLEKNKFTVLSINGDTHLGGEDFDNKLVEFCIKLFKDENGIDVSNNPKALKRLKNECEKKKEELSESIETEINLEYFAEGIEFNSKILRTDFENICKDLFNKLIPPIKEALNDAKLNKEDIDDIILVGGSSRIPKIQEMLSEFFNKKNLKKTVNPDEIVAQGAALLASILKEEGNLKIIDINPISLGINSILYDDKQKKYLYDNMEILINKNVQLPYINEKIFITHYDNQTNITFEVYQGENKNTKDNYFLNSFRICGLRKAPKGKIEFIVKMELDENGILKVSAKEIKGTHYGEITIMGVNDLTNEQIEFFKNQEKQISKRK